MKNIVTLFVALFTLTIYAQTKDELIEKLLIVSNAKTQFGEMRQAALSTYGDGLSDDEIMVINTHCTWESMKEFRFNIIDECYTKDEIEMMIKLYENPEFKELSKKFTKFAFIAKKGDEQWVKSIMPKIRDDMQKLPRNEEETPATRASVWNSWSDKQQWNFVDGYKQGTAFSCSIIRRELESQSTNTNTLVSETNELLSLNTDTIKLCRAVTTFYEDPENSNIEHIYSLHFADALIEGKDITEKLEKARKTFAESPNQRVEPTLDNAR